MSSNKEPTRPENGQILNWLSDPVTEWFVSEIQYEIDSLLTSLANGETLSENAHQTNQQTAKAVGGMEALNKLADKLVIEESE